ncbi:NAD(P)-dependent oxidoreductase [Gemmatimonas sp.]|uniref:NAD(P)-dependent oxidoreductase n=1 Tax=Gemmatimonas sp. TaxID=1962908 RepID=UPI003562DCBE
MSEPQSRVLILHVAKSNLEPAYTHLRAALGSTPSVLFDPEFPIADQMAGKDVVIDIGGWGRAEHIEAGRQAGVKLWQVAGYGLDHLALDEVLASGMDLARTPGPTTAVPLAEHAMFLLLAVQKQANLARSALEAQHFYDSENGELAGKTLVVIGTGASGRELARRAHGFAMRVIGVDLFPMSDSDMREFGVDRFASLDELASVLSEADVVSLHLPLTDETTHSIGEAAFNSMKRGAVLINVARGALVDEAAMVRALESGQLGGAGLDVFEVEPMAPDHPLLSMPNVVLTPHWAAATTQTFVRRSEVAGANVNRVLNGERPAFLVNGR